MLLMQEQVMCKCINVSIIVEGATESNFIKKILAPYMADKGIYLTPVQAHKSGQSGGDIKFQRIAKDISVALKQRSDIYVTIFIDFYGIAEWPDKASITAQSTHTQKHEAFINTTSDKINEYLEKETRLNNSINRFIPNVCMHEFEALLFSEPSVLASNIGCSEQTILDILRECSEPENINNSPNTAPQKRILSLNSSYKKVITGNKIATEIGIEKMREKCPLFHQWLNRLESLQPL